MEKHTHSHIFLRILGGLFLILGGIALYYGPLEFYCLYLFSQNGPFFYEGFGVGSIWLALLLCHNLGYYIVASICLPLGAGTLSRSRWALTWSRVFFVVWLAGGITVFLMLLVFLPRLFTLSLPFQTPSCSCSFGWFLPFSGRPCHSVWVFPMVWKLSRRVFFHALRAVSVVGTHSPPPDPGIPGDVRGSVLRMASLDIFPCPVSSVRESACWASGSVCHCRRHCGVTWPDVRHRKAVQVGMVGDVSLFLTAHAFVCAHIECL